MDGGLKPAEELFCKLYAGLGDWFNNAVRSYGIAYDYELPSISKVKSDWTNEEKLSYHQAGVEAHRLLKKPKIRRRCEEILLEEFKDEMADKELAWTLKQREDLSAKINAIKEYNKLKQRIVDKTDITTAGKPFPLLGGVTKKDGEIGDGNP